MSGVPEIRANGRPADEPIPESKAALALALTPGLGAIRARRLMERFGSAASVLGHGPAAIGQVEGIGPATAEKAVRGFERAVRQAADEIAQLEAMGGVLTALGQPNYPRLLAPLPDAPVALLHRGGLADVGGYPVAIVGSRQPTHYGIEQAERFAGAMASAGLTIVSGGARGIDAAAHRAALAAGGRTVVVLGSGLGVPYPPEHADLFDEIAGSGRGAIVSELPVRTQPAPRHFPTRNRIISGLSLGVLVVEAGRKSGALITARLATETHGRETMAVPGRIDAPASAGCNELLKSGGAALVTEPADVIDALESVARVAYPELHLMRHGFSHDGSVPEVTSAADRPVPERVAASIGGASARDHHVEPGPSPAATAGLDGEARAVLEALDEPRTPDQLAEMLGVGIVALRTAVTSLDLAGLIRRDGTRIARRKTRF